MDHVSPSSDTIFAQAIEIESPEDRSAFLHQACQGDAQLLGEVKQLVLDHFKAGNFLERPAINRQQTSAFSPVSETAGTQVGPYKLLQQIGEGGMGVVYMAEQQKPVRRRVALKIIKPGMDSKQVIARFEAERQALAMMDHPNIARVLDAGCTETGRPYFAMELVQGIPITQYCDDKQLSPQERLELFIQVCHAVQHAHQKGIIHRDLKPSNVLVMIYDGKPIPKIIDFGVAKALHQQLTEKTMFTQFGSIVGTLEYMSPEQAEMDAMGTDTRSDIYSLGVLLYELLTGTTPMDGKKLRSLGYAEMLKTIRDVDPPKPSTRLSQSAHDLANISAKRHTEPRRLQKMVAGDLDWIVMKCLEKDRTRRYETANGLAMDIQRHLHDEAVTASPPGQVYKLQKLVRRNKLACTAAACVMLALVLGLAASLWQADRAAREAARAQNEAARAQQEADRANKALNDLQAAAPSIAADARARAAKGNFDQALEKLDYAAMLQQDAPELLVAKGDLYLCQLKLSQAAAVYRDAVRLKPGFAPAEMKANLCDRLLAASQSAQGKLDLESLAEIYSALEPEKRSATELFAVREAYADEKERLWKYWLPRLQSLPMFANILSGEDEWAWAGRFDIRNDGQLILYLGNLDPGDLSQLKDLPVADLYLAQCKNVADVQPLADMPSLENITVPALARNIEALHKPPKLKRIAFSYKAELSSDEQIRKYYQLASSTLSEAKKQEQGSNNSLDQNALLRRMQLFGIDGRWGRSTPATTAEEFWKEYPTLSWLSRLRDAAIKPIDVTRQTDGTWAVTVHDPKFTDCSFFAGSNVRRLDLDQSQVTDLSPLADLPLAALSLRETPVKDLSPLRSPTLRDSLRELRVWRTKITDFSPVAGCAKLELFDAADTQLTDLSIIKGMKLHTLLIERTSVTDLAPVAGMPLTNLDISRTRVADLSPLLKCQTLKSIILPQNAKDVGSLHGLPNLARVSYTSKGGNPDKSADEFWGSGQTEEPWIVALRKANLNFSQRRLADKSWALTLDDQPITDLSSLKGANITQLSIARTPVADLAPLRGMRLTNLKIGGSKVTDLSPIKGMALTSVQLSGTAVRDLSPLTGMPLRGLIMTSCKEITDLSPLADMASTLETVILPTNAKDIEFLRAFPNLARLSYKFDATIKGPAQTAHEFWAEYDRAKSAAP